jgi:hypothetical protein
MDDVILEPHDDRESSQIFVICDQGTPP